MLNRREISPKLASESLGAFGGQTVNRKVVASTFEEKMNNIMDELTNPTGEGKVTHDFSIAELTMVTKKASSIAQSFNMEEVKPLYHEDIANLIDEMDKIEEKSGIDNSHLIMKAKNRQLRYYSEENQMWAGNSGMNKLLALEVDKKKVYLSVVTPDFKVSEVVHNEAAATEYEF